MIQKHASSALAAILVVMMTGCVSSSPDQKATAQQPQQPQQRDINALKMASRGSVELTVSYCDSHRVIPGRKQVVTLGETAIFAPTDATIWELKIKPFKTVDGKVIMSMTAKWQDNVERRDFLFSRQVFTQDGEISPQSVLNINGHDTCFTVTARSVPNVAN